jgi:serine protease AprX
MPELPYVASLFPALSIPARMRAETHYSGKGVCIAMIDSGFVAHPDLTMPENRILYYYDAVVEAGSEMPPLEAEVYSWHGTMTACTAAGNGYLSRKLYSSLAYNARLVLVRTMDENGSLPTHRIAHALDWCLEHAEDFGINIINMSLHADEVDFSMEHPVTARVEEAVRRGIVVVAASGNNPRMPIYPPASAPSAITVGGLDDKNDMTDDDELYHSSYGSLPDGVSKPDVIAPAIWLPAPILPGTPTHEEAAALCALDNMLEVMLMKTLPHLIEHTSLPVELLELGDIVAIRSQIAERLTDECIISPNYKHVDGTSFAAPIVCSIVAQMLEANPRLTPAEIKEILNETARFLPNYPREPQGHGIVQATAAVEFAAATRRIYEEDEARE